MNAATAFDLHLIVLAGGTSTRARRGKASAPKQFRRIGGQMLLMVSVRELLRLPEVVSLTITVPEPYRAITGSALDDAFDDDLEVDLVAASTLSGIGLRQFDLIANAAGTNDVGTMVVVVTVVVVRIS